MLWKILSAVLAFVLSAIAYYPYLRAIKNSKKNRMEATMSSWIAWGAIDVTLVASTSAREVVFMQLFAYIIGVALVVGYSFYKGAVMGWNWDDAVCLIGVGVAIWAWIHTKNPDNATYCCIAAGAISMIPISRKLWFHPEKEPLVPWYWFTAGSVFGIGAVTKWDVVHAGVPIENFLAQILTVALIWRKFRKGYALAQGSDILHES